MSATTDRGEIMHLAGRYRLSPAIRDGAPTFVPTTETAGRCGWERFFAALDATSSQVEWDPADEELKIVPRK
jgi:hypothetical protein